MQRASVLISLAIVLAACSADNGDEGIFITKNVSPGTDCTFTASTNEPYNPHGTVSVFSPQGYMLFPQLISKITSRDDNVQARTIQVRGSRVDLQITDSTLSGISGDGVTHFESRFSAPISPNGGITDAAFEAIPAAFLKAVASAKTLSENTVSNFSTEVIVHAVVYGDLSGTEVISQDYEYPVTVCTNCVRNNLGTCPLPIGTVVNERPNPCGVYQDSYVDCCMGPTGIQCPASVTPAP